MYVGVGVCVCFIIYFCFCLGVWVCWSGCLCLFHKLLLSLPLILFGWVFNVSACFLNILRSLFLFLLLFLLLRLHLLKVDVSNSSLPFCLFVVVSHAPVFDSAFIIEGTCITKAEKEYAMFQMPK